MSHTRGVPGNIVLRALPLEKTLGGYTLRKVMLFGLVAALVACVAVGPADAGFKRLGSSGFTFLKIAQGARAAAMGDAYASVADGYGYMRPEFH